MTDLSQLYAVQELDTRLDLLRYQRVHLPERAALAEANAAITATDAALKANSTRQDALTAQFTQQEQRTKQLETRRTKLEAQLRTIVVPREAEALQREIAATKTEHEAADEEGIVVLDELETLSAQADELNAARSRQQGTADEATAALAAAEADVDAQIAAATVERAAAAGLVPEALVARYEALRPSFKGVALARLEGSMCTGCHMNLSRVEFEAVRAALERGEGPECPQCGRLLVR